ncbi:septin-7-like [Brachionichthys hirsutus]|uniref:septin-7-like n=1 Tax=Brachionichthys hirsutus TaxID=412623 RepID=UPI00360476D2
MATNIIMATEKYRDICLTSQLIRSGSPAIFKLNPKTENIGALVRLTIGDQNVNTINKTILLVGETGSGKSTLIDSLVNYAMGVTWEDDVWFKIVNDQKAPSAGQSSEEHNEPNQSESQTSEVIVYRIFGFEGKTLPYSLTIIDTPGYGDTKGIKKDDVIKEQLLDWFRSDNGINEINAVGLVMKSADNRLTDRLRYVFDSVVSLFGKNMEQNIVALITHSDGLVPQDALKALVNANIKCAKNEKRDPRHFLFNNRQMMERKEEDLFVLKFASDFSKFQMDQFTKFIGKASPQKLNTTVDVLNERNRLKSVIISLEERVQTIELQRRQITQERNILENCEKDMKNNKNYIEDVDEVYKEKKKIEGGRWGILWLSYRGAMNCLKCEETCHHEGCIHATNPDDGCAVMEDGYCTVCTGKCPTEVHVKDTWIFVTKTKKVRKTKEDVKKKYEESKKDSEKHLSILQLMEKKMDEYQREKDKWLDESFQHIKNLERIALNVDSLSTLVHLDFLIERMEERNDRAKLQELKEMKKRADKGASVAMGYMNKNKI